MTQSKTGAVATCGRLAKSLPSFALATSALAGTLLISASPASAACPSPQIAGGFTLNIISPPTGAAADCSLTNPGGNLLQANEDVDFNPNIFNGGGEYRYSIEHVLGYKFIEVGIDSDTDGLGGSTLLTKQLFSDAAFSVPYGPTLQSITGSQSSAALDGTLSKIWVIDTYSATGSTGLDNITNKYMATPGPLPILGAGAAFGFSRRLRGRIKAARLS